MKDITLIEKTLFEISQVLASDEKVQRLLVIDTPDALTKTYTIKPVKDILDGQYICLAPELESGIVDKGRNTFMVIRIDDISMAYEKENLNVRGSIFIGTDKDRVLINDNKHRLLQLANQVIHKVQGTKFSAAGYVDVNNITAITFSEYMFGYRISFSFKDQETRKAEL